MRCRLEFNYSIKLKYLSSVRTPIRRYPLECIPSDCPVGRALEVKGETKLEGNDHWLRVYMGNTIRNIVRTVRLMGRSA